MIVADAGMIHAVTPAEMNAVEMIAVEINGLMGRDRRVREVAIGLRVRAARRKVVRRKVGLVPDLRSVQVTREAAHASLGKTGGLAKIADHVKIADLATAGGRGRTADLARKVGHKTVQHEDHVKIVELAEAMASGRAEIVRRGSVENVDPKDKTEKAMNVRIDQVEREGSISQLAKDRVDQKVANAGETGNLEAVSKTVADGQVRGEISAVAVRMNRAMNSVGTHVAIPGVTAASPENSAEIVRICVLTVGQDPSQA